MLTNYDKRLTEYWKNWKLGMGPYKGNKSKEEPKKQEVKHTKKLKKEKKSPREFMEEIQFEYGLDEKELDDLLIPEEEWDDLEN